MTVGFLNYWGYAKATHSGKGGGEQAETENALAATIQALKQVTP